MENIQHNSSLTKRKVLGLLGLIVFSLAFIFACLFSVLPIGRAIVGTFGIATYPLLIILDFYSLAKFLGLNYTKRMKPAVLLTIGIVSVLLVIHAMLAVKHSKHILKFHIHQKSHFLEVLVQFCVV